MYSIKDAIKKEKMTLFVIAILIPVIMIFCEYMDLMDRIGVNLVIGIGIVIAANIICIVILNIRHAIDDTKLYAKGHRLKPIFIHFIGFIFNLILLAPILYFGIHRDLFCALSGGLTAIFINSLEEKIISTVCLVLVAMLIDIWSAYCSIRREYDKDC